MDKEDKTFLTVFLIALVGAILIASVLIYGIESSNEIYEQRKKEFHDTLHLKIDSALKLDH